MRLFWNLNTTRNPKRYLSSWANSFQLEQQHNADHIIKNLIHWLKERRKIDYRTNKFQQSFYQKIDIFDSINFNIVCLQNLIIAMLYPKNIYFYIYRIHLFMTVYHNLSFLFILNNFFFNKLKRHQIGAPR